MEAHGLELGFYPYFIIGVTRISPFRGIISRVISPMGLQVGYRD